MQRPHSRAALASALLLVSAIAAAARDVAFWYEVSDADQVPVALQVLC